jgi:hypothetical protein
MLGRMSAPRPDGPHEARPGTPQPTVVELGAARPGGAGFAERLWPGPLGWVLVVGFAGLFAVALWPVRPALAAVAGLVALAATTTAAVVSSPRVSVVGGELRAGDAHIALDLLGAARALDRAETRHELGPALDARTYVCLRAWVGTAVRVEVRDPADPTPCWIVSTRHPHELVAALGTGAGPGSGDTRGR